MEISKDFPKAYENVQTDLALSRQGSAGLDRQKGRQVRTVLEVTSYN